MLTRGAAPGAPSTPIHATFDIGQAMARVRTARDRAQLLAETPRGYNPYLHLALPNLFGGLVIADNTLWSGKVLDPRDPSDHAIVRFNAHVAADPRVEHVLLAVRDGIMLARKLRD